MLNATLIKLFTRDLNKLKAEIAAYQDESVIWKIDKGIGNSAGNLCLHLMGNINHFIGAQLGGTGYVRNRELEFSLKDIPREQLIQQIEHTLTVTATTLDNLTSEQFTADYPIIVFDEKMSTEFFMIHLSTHLAYHLGQINYHRRLLDI